MCASVCVCTSERDAVGMSHALIRQEERLLIVVRMAGALHVIL